MEKVEVINKAWTDIVGEKAFESISSYIDETDGTIDWDDRNGAFEVRDLFEVIGKNDGNHYVRPKSLRGIENNNGWIKIESESDLPEHSENDEDVFFQAGILDEKGWFPYFDFYRAYEIQDRFHNSPMKITHFKEIKTNQPLY